MVVSYHALSQFASEVRRGTLIVRVLGAHAPTAHLPKRAELFRVVGSRFIALETIREDRFLRAVTKPLPKYSVRVSAFVVTVRWSLTGEDVGNIEAGRGEDSGRRRGTRSEEMGKKAGMNHSVSKITLHSEKFALGAIFGIGELHFSPLHILQLNLISLIPMYISDDPWVFKVDQGIVDKESTSG